jgi:hypothetical protein
VSVAAFTAACEAAGLDLVQPFAVGGYNRAVEPRYALPDLGRAENLGPLVGNSAALWPRFIGWLTQDPSRLDDPNPLDAYVVERVSTAAAVFGQALVRYSHRPPPERFAAIRMAVVSGLAHEGESGLAVHPRFGPWFAIRAAVVVAEPGPREPAPTISHPCGDCVPHCLTRLPDAVADGGWTRWLAVRDACPVGREYRYSEEQLRYHYTHERAVLRAAVAKASGLQP